MLRYGILILMVLCTATFGCGDRNNNSANGGGGNNNRLDSSSNSNDFECEVPAGTMTATFNGNDTLRLQTEENYVFVLERASDGNTGLYDTWDMKQVQAQENGVAVNVEWEEFAKTLGQEIGFNVTKLQFRFTQQGKFETLMVVQPAGGSQAVPCLASANASISQIDGNGYRIVSQGAKTKI